MALAGQRPHWDRVQHFVFVLLPQASFDQYFGAFPDSEGRPGPLGSGDVPNYWAYADLYTLQDHFFGSPDPATLLRAQAARLDAAGIVWKDYSSDLASFADDCRNETLPAVSFLLPAQVSGPEMAYLTQAVNAVAGSRLWRRSAVFVAWAGAGDSPDHMAPPPGVGARVPSLVISPWARMAYNDHRVYSHLSWVRSIENRFGLAHEEDAVADLYDPFDFAQQPREPVLLDPGGARSYPVIGQGQVFPASGWLDSVHRSHGTWTVAPGSMVIGYGDGFVLEEEAGPDPSLSAVSVTDALGVTRQAAVQYTGKSQVNYVVPAGTAPGLAQVRIDTARLRFDGFLLVERVSPGLFTATQMGQGPADGDAITAEGLESTFTCEAGLCRSVPVRGRTISLRGTGFRGAREMRVWVDGREARVVSFGPDPDVEGLDRVALELPEGARGQVLVLLGADGIVSNSAQLLIAGAEL